MEKSEVQQMIDESLKKSFTQKRVGDTPTDALQLVNKKYVDSKGAYSGIVASGGTGTLLPTGWTSVKTGTGNYTVTHNLNLTSTSYSVVVCLSGGGTGFAEVDAQGVNSFNVDTFNSGSSLSDHQFNFVMK